MSVAISPVSPVQCHIQSCTDCRLNYEHLPPQVKKAADCIFTLMQVSNARNGFLARNEEAPKAVMKKLTEARNSCNFHCKTIAFPERFAAHVIAHCALESSVLQQLNPPST